MDSLSHHITSAPPVAASPKPNGHDQLRDEERRNWSPRLDGLRMHLGRAIRRRRLSRNMTLQTLAGSSGVSFQQIQKYETGQQAISAAQLWMIACALGVSVADLFDAPETD